MVTTAEKKAAEKAKKAASNVLATPGTAAAIAAIANLVTGTTPEPGKVILVADTDGNKKPAAIKNRKKAPATGSSGSFFSFELTGDKPDVNFNDLRGALEFKQDFPTLIKKEHKFKTLVRFNNHVARRSAANSLKTPPRSTTAFSTATGTNENKTADAIAALLADSRPVDALAGHFKTTPSSKIMAILIRCTTQWNSDFWGFKPNSMASVLNKFSTIAPSVNVSVQEALQNLTYGKARDPDSSSPSTSLVVHYTPPGKKDVILIDVYVAYTYVTIPYETISSVKEETTWMSDTTTNVMQEIKTIMSSDIFKSVLEKTTHESFFHKLYAPERKSNLPKFLNSCVVRSLPCLHYTDHVVQDVSNMISDKMFECRLQNRKYPDATLQADFDLLAKDIEEEDNEDDDDDLPSESDSKDSVSAKNVL